MPTAKLREITMTPAEKVRRHLEQRPDEQGSLLDRVVPVSPDMRQLWIETPQIAFDDLDVVARIVEHSPVGAWTGAVLGVAPDGSIARSRAPVTDELTAGPAGWAEIQAIPLAILA
jgi:hypothetical protein